MDGVLSKMMQLKCIPHHEVWGKRPQPLGDFCDFSKKKIAIANLFESYFTRF